MSPLPKNLSASVKARLQNKARETGRVYQELLQRHAMERFLYRLSQSGHADQFVLKGALLFSVWQTEYERRTTLDIDLLDYSFRLLNESNGSYTHHLVSTLSLDLIDDMDLDLSLVWDRVQDPTPNAAGELPDQDDYQLIFSLTYDFYSPN